MMKEREPTAHRDVRGLTMCPTRLPALRLLPLIVIPGTPREGRRKSALPAQKQAAARVISVVTDLSIDHRMTTLIARRWDAGASQKAGAERNPRPNTRSSTTVTSSPVPPVALIGIDDSPMPQRFTAEQCNKWHHAVRPGAAAEAAAGPDKDASLGVRGLTMCRNDLPATRPRSGRVTLVTSSPVPPVALIGNGNLRSPERLQPNNATNGTTPYVPEP